MITPQQIAAPSVTIEEKSDGLLIHVSAQSGEMGQSASFPGPIRYCHTFSCTFVYDTRRGLLWSRGFSRNRLEPSMARTKIDCAATAVQRINDFLASKAAGREWW